MNVLEKASCLFPDTKLDDWRMVGEAAVHRSIDTGRCRFYGPAILRGGVFRGGEFQGGVFRGGVFRGAPIQIAGLLPWVVTVGRPGEISIGCQCMTADEWRARGEVIAAKECVEVTDHLRQGATQAVVIVEQWLRDHPGVVVTEEAAR